MYSTTCFIISAILIVVSVGVFILTLKLIDKQNYNVGITYTASIVGFLVGILILIHGIRFLEWESLVCGFSSFVISKVM